MSTTYHVRIQKERLVFCAAHFITYAGNICEPLHGHNYHVAAEVEGPLDENRYVVDFIALRDALQSLVDSLDHRVILPTSHPAIHVVESDGEFGPEVVATFESRRWVFPRADCVLLPVENTTAEQLAHHLATELQMRLDLSGASRIRIEIDECDGQWGVYEQRCDA
ncbi:MAG: 6-pyruvoyl tetrahydropterin synthase family protein [Planctomycetales bacterium]|nr:6-pyruvoyl tetrahydropterin synthase family protein [Planctomycetales bacterium]